MRVIGLDLSLSSTGVAIVDDIRTVPISVHRVLSQPAERPDGLRPSLDQRAIRLGSITDRIMFLIGSADLALVEGPAYGAPQGAHEIGWNWGMVVDRLVRAGVPVAEATPGQVKKYATGSGSTSGKTKVTKQMVIQAVQMRYGDVGRSITRTDEADALVLAAMCCRYLGRPLEGSSLPPANMAALKEIRWPERTLV